MRFLSPRSDKNAVMDYSAAVASAVEWLGNRYLLARPAGRLNPDERRSTDFTTAASTLRRSRSPNNQRRDAAAKTVG
jgi:hypothetical protein